ncbi:MAG: hypothetical protein MJE77_10585 [Proteobacteria bacterium]|nr:hypothetical protein [Pseudomonadota bacterium]
MTEWSMFEDLHPGTPALTLADAFLYTVGCKDPEETERTRSVILIAAEHLAETTGPLTWERFKVAEFFRKIAFMSEHEQVGVALTLVGFYGWMIFEGLIGGPDGLSIMDAVATTSPPSDVLRDFYRKSCQLIPVPH